MFAGSVSAGGVVSTTVTWNVAVPVLCCVSVALHVTVVVPSANVEPLAGEQTTGRGPSALSDAAAVNVTTAPLGLVASAVMSSGTSRSGGVVSPTGTLNEPVAVLPVESLAVHVTGVVPSKNVEPDGDVPVTCTPPSGSTF